MENVIFTLFVGISMATVNVQTDFEHSLGNYDILSFIMWQLTPQNNKLQIFRKSEAKKASYQPWSFNVYFQPNIGHQDKMISNS